MPTKQDTDTRGLPLHEKVDDAWSRAVRGRVRQNTLASPTRTYDEGPLGTRFDPLYVNHESCLDVSDMRDVSSDATPTALFPILQYLTPTTYSTVLRDSIVAALLAIARLSADDLRTQSLELGPAIRRLWKHSPISVSVSPALFKGRAETLASSLFAPSGVELTWQTIERDTQRGRV